MRFKLNLIFSNDFKLDLTKRLIFNFCEINNTNTSVLDNTSFKGNELYNSIENFINNHFEEDIKSRKIRLLVKSIELEGYLISPITTFNNNSFKDLDTFK